ncbi:MAG: RsmD family RNA methyltransferase [Treponema sp.]|jgi:16S rRNA (guanine(966)-N(2))-methyltransferase RsmD|nr:RsmD family RNA methyltransferase [Treponema sp.]
MNSMNSSRIFKRLPDLRITGGLLKGRRIEVPPGLIRPSMDRMRESVFAALGDLGGCSFLDIFSGTGIIALEAASRGAGYIEAVEMDSLKRKALINNVSISPVRIRCRFMAAELYVERAKRSFDYIFLDPPFPYRFKWELVRNIASSPLAADGARILLHRPREDFFEEEIPFIQKDAPRIYGRSVVEFLLVRKAAQENLGENTAT